MREARRKRHPPTHLWTTGPTDASVRNRKTAWNRSPDGRIVTSDNSGRARIASIIGAHRSGGYPRPEARRNRRDARAGRRSTGRRGIRSSGRASRSTSRARSRCSRSACAGDVRCLRKCTASRSNCHHDVTRGGVRRSPTAVDARAICRSARLPGRRPAPAPTHIRREEPR